jgi:spore maturation protein SpmA
VNASQHRSAIRKVASPGGFRVSLASKERPMLKELQDLVAVAVHLALASTLGLNLAIVAAGIANARTPVGCKACTQGAVLSAKPPASKPATLALLKPKTL